MSNTRLELELVEKVLRKIEEDPYKYINKDWYSYFVVRLGLFKIAVHPFPSSTNIYLRHIIYKDQKIHLEKSVVNKNEEIELLISTAHKYMSSAIKEKGRIETEIKDNIISRLLRKFQ